jgi:tetratricopeptide (TPR) repeat protein
VLAPKAPPEAPKVTPPTPAASSNDTAQLQALLAEYHDFACRGRALELDYQRLLAAYEDPSCTVPNKYDRMAELCTVTISLRPLRSHYVQRATYYEKAGKPAEAAADRAVAAKMGDEKLGTYDLTGLLRRGREFTQTKQFMAAAGEYSRLIEVWPVAPEFYTSRAKCYDQAGRYDLAAADYATADSLSAYWRQAAREAYAKAPRPEAGKR